MGVTFENTQTREELENANLIKSEDLNALQNVDEYKNQLRQLPEVTNLTSQISITNTQTILNFGQEPSERLSKSADTVMSTMKSIKPEEGSAMLVRLSSVMNKFNANELENIKNTEGAIKRLFFKAKEKYNEIFEKYENMGKEIGDICELLKKYELDIQKANNDLSKQYEANITYFRTLEKYIVAGELALEEVESIRAQFESDTSVSEMERNMRLQKIDMAKELLDQRIMDLRMAENVAMQTCPMLATMQMSNYNLLRKINSSLMITLPLFKNCLIQAVQLKRQEIQAKSIAELDKTTKEMFERNARMTGQQSVEIAKLSGTSTFDTETLTKAYEDVKRGLEETKRVKDELAEKRKEETIKLEALKQDMKANNFV